MVSIKSWKRMLARLVMMLVLIHCTKGRVSPAVLAKLVSSTRNINIVKRMANGMGSDANTGAYVGGTGIRAKVGAFGRKWTKTAKLEFRKDPEGNAERIGEAINGIGDGIIGFVNGIKNNDWKGGVQGALSIISSVAAFAGPVGMIASSVLSFVSSLFDLFGGSQETESMDDKIERIVAKQINIGRVKDLQADFQGLKVAYRSLTASIQHFRESKKLEEGQANELYNHAFLELPVFGKIQAMIKEKCNDVQDEDDAYTEANKCLGTIQMYAEASILRQLLLTNMASLMADVHERENGGEEYVEGTEKNVTGGLLVVSNNVLNLIKKEQEADRTELRFLGDPFNNPPRRYVTGVFFANPYKYPTLRTYLRSLDKEAPGSIFKEYVMVCREQDLLGSCVTLEQGEYFNLTANPKGWNNAIKSFFLPRGLKLTANDDVNNGGDTWGPFVGPTVHARVQQGGTYDFSAIKIESTDRDADNEVRFCEQTNMALGLCDSAPVGKHNLKNYNGRNWEKKLKSMYMPLGLEVEGYKRANQRGSPFVFYHGPYTVNKVDGENQWKSIEVKTTSADASENVEMCDAVNFGGHCIVFGINTNQLAHIGGHNFDKKVYSMKIPGGVHITGYTEIDHGGVEIGPYHGPAVLAKMDEAQKWRSLKLTKISNGRSG